ncbi:hypothetical protein RFI_04364 [Reticulomyxa filosa]|uniref:GAIN-B domain-containing protein n=1 Tax=Reticulomyxa filosa TaxID=46433 RepID=X6P3T8_RETFI|nr:hypothetical protein RFI_04364 [Reticulomyxa filosa]|eukprot:ETO32754.1 hypothetical protein RFI_04364 [Reticulomyxa filosa]
MNTPVLFIALDMDASTNDFGKQDITWELPLRSSLMSCAKGDFGLKQYNNISQTTSISPTHNDNNNNDDGNIEYTFAQMCGFYHMNSDAISDSWDTKGCKLNTSNTKPNTLRCSCNHLTYFGGLDTYQGLNTVVVVFFFCFIVYVCFSIFFWIVANIKKYIHIHIKLN